MLFNSVEFLLFFTAVFIVYFSVSNKYRWVVLLVASYYFYMSWNPYYAGLIILSTLVDYYAGLRIGDSSHKIQRKCYLAASICTNLAILFTFKYYGFFTSNLESLITQLSVPDLNLLLPIGISFYTFQSMSYTIDVYRGDKDPEPRLGKFALYVAFFPQLIAGPIERSTRLLPQFDRKVTFDYQRVVDGLKLATWGMFQKVVIADRLALLVDEVYASPQDFNASLLALSTYFFQIQILCDFQGYTNIAQGTAKMLGFDLMTNFRQPYFAKSISKFWVRFHISMTSWFRDYVYYPLAGIKPGFFSWVFNITLLFSIIGLWHGASWTFLIFGLYHAFFYLVYAGLRKSAFRPSAWPGLVGHFLAIGICYHVVWASGVAFRANNLSDLLYVWKMLPYGLWTLVTNAVTPTFWMTLSSALRRMGTINIILSLVLILFFMTIEAIDAKRGLWNWLNERSYYTRWGFYHLLLLGIFFLGIWQRYEFIYFQF